MKISKKILKRIIAEEIQKVVTEFQGVTEPGGLEGGGFGTSSKEGVCPTYIPFTGLNPPFTEEVVMAEWNKAKEEIGSDKFDRLITRGIRKLPPQLRDKVPSHLVPEGPREEPSVPSVPADPSLDSVDIETLYESEGLVVLVELGIVIFLIYHAIGAACGG